MQDCVLSGAGDDDSMLGENIPALVVLTEKAARCLQVRLLLCGYLKGLIVLVA